MSRRPVWIVKDLADILGFDEATVSEAILPELESQNHQSRLKSHLQDFLGPSSRARSFIEKYISFRFPNIPTSTPASAPSLKSASQNGYQRSQPPSGSRTPYTPSSSAFPPPQPSPSANSNLGQAVSDAFDASAGSTSGGRVQNKSSQADSARSSGYNTPQFRQPARQAGSLVIHEAKPKNKSRATNGGGGPGGKGEQGKGERIWDVPKSKEVKRLEGLVEKLGAVRDGRMVERGDEIPDCFCQARVHKLSPYTPHCPHCGLILCALQPPYLPCPSCFQTLYSPAQLARLIMRISTEIEEQLESEQAERDAIEKERQDRLIAESGGGAFPTLPGGSGGSRPQTMADASRKVLTIGGSGKGKGKAVLTTTTYRQSPTPAVSEPATPMTYDTIARPRSPPLEAGRIEKEVEKWAQWRKTEDRPWGDMKADNKGETWTYIELPLSQWVEEGTEGRRKAAKKKKKEGGQGENGRVVPGAA